MHLKYPTLLRDLRTLTLLDFVEPVYVDGEPAFKRHSRQKAAADVRYEPTKYHYQITTKGRRFLDAYENMIQVFLQEVSNSTLKHVASGELELFDGEFLKKRKKDELR
jgi:hypothetical protein